MELGVDWFVVYRLILRVGVFSGTPYKCTGKDSWKLELLFVSISVPKWAKLGPQSTPKAVDEAIAVNKNTPEPILRSKRPVVRPGGSMLTMFDVFALRVGVRSERSERS